MTIDAKYVFVMTKKTREVKVCKTRKGVYPYIQMGSDVVCKTFDGDIEIGTCISDTFSDQEEGFCLLKKSFPEYFFDTKVGNILGEISYRMYDEIDEVPEDGENQ